MSRCPGSTRQLSGTATRNTPCSSGSPAPCAAGSVFESRLLDTSTFTLDCGPSSVGITCSPGSSMTEKAGATVNGRSAVAPEASLYLTMQTADTAPAPVLPIMPSAFTGGGGKGSPRYCGSSIVLSASDSGSFRCQYGRVGWAVGET